MKIDLSVVIDILNSWFILILFCHLIMLKKFKSRCNKYLSFILILFIIVFTYYNLHFTNLNAYSELKILAFLIIILYSIFFKGNIIHISLNCIILLQLFLFSRVWIYIVYYILTALNLHSNFNVLIIEFINNNQFLSRNIIFLILSLSLYRNLYARYVNFDYVYNNKKLLYTSIIFSLINYDLLLYIFLKISNIESNNTIIFIITLISLISIAFLSFIVLLIKVISEKYFANISLQMIENQLDIQLNHYKNLEYYINKTSIITHDTKHHLLALDILLENDDITEAKKYLKTIKNDLFLLDKSKSCENKLVDAIIQSININCLKNEISFTYDLNFPETLPIDNCDLVVILGNLLNNSLEACTNITDINVNKFIKISTKILNNNLVIKIENSTTNKLIKKNDGLFKTTKKDKLLHGLGLVSVKNSISKYDGSYNITTATNLFKLVLLIPINK